MESVIRIPLINTNLTSAEAQSHSKHLGQGCSPTSVSLHGVTSCSLIAISGSKMDTIDVGLAGWLACNAARN